MKQIGLVLLILFFLNACITSSSTQASLSVPVEVAMQKYKFIPQVLEIKVGQSVKWINKEKRQYHSVWFEKQGEEESEYLFPDDVWNKTFDKPGVYEYRCGPHPEMIGKIIVK